MSSTTTVRILPGRKGRLTRWMIEVERDGKREVVLPPWPTKNDAIISAKLWAKENDVEHDVVFLIARKG